jgi:hypothetical protein
MIFAPTGLLVPRAKPEKSKEALAKPESDSFGRSADPRTVTGIGLKSDELTVPICERGTAGAARLLGEVNDLVPPKAYLGRAAGEGC